MRGRDRDRSALAGWPDDQAADVRRAAAAGRPPTVTRPSTPPALHPRDPQHGTWDDPDDWPGDWSG